MKTCTLTARSGTQYEFEIAMGEPHVEEERPLKIARGEARGSSGVHGESAFCDVRG